MCWPSAVRLAGSERAARVDGRSLARASARSRGSWEFLSLIRLGLTMGVQESSGRLRDPDILTSSPIFFPARARSERNCVRPLTRQAGSSHPHCHTAAAHKTQPLSAFASGARETRSNGTGTSTSTGTGTGTGTGPGPGPGPVGGRGAGASGAACRWQRSAGVTATSSKMNL